MAALVHGRRCYTTIWDTTLAGGAMALRGKVVTFIVEFRDGRKLMATIEQRTQRSEPIDRC